MLPLPMFFQLRNPKFVGPVTQFYLLPQQFSTRDLKDGQLSFVFKFIPFFFFLTKSLLCWEKDPPFL